MNPNPEVIQWLLTLISTVLGALVGTLLSTITVARQERRRWRREDVVYWRTERRHAYAATLANLIEARDLLVRMMQTAGNEERYAKAAEAMGELSSRAAPVNFGTRMIASAAVRTAVAAAADALNFDYGDASAVSAERVEHFRALVRKVHQELSIDLRIEAA